MLTRPFPHRAPVPRPRLLYPEHVVGLIAGLSLAALCIHTGMQKAHCAVSSPASYLHQIQPDGDPD